MTNFPHHAPRTTILGCRDRNNLNSSPSFPFLAELNVKRNLINHPYIHLQKGTSIKNLSPSSFGSITPASSITSHVLISLPVHSKQTSKRQQAIHPSSFLNPSLIMRIGFLLFRYTSIIPSLFLTYLKVKFYIFYVHINKGIRHAGKKCKRYL